MNPSFWSGRKVFLTGHTGFKGAWLSLWLHRMGATVTGYSLAPDTNPNLYEVARVGECVTSVEGDIRDLPALKQAMHQAQPEIVIHMAAQSLVRRSYLEPVDTMATNVLGTVNVLESVRTVGSVKAVVNVTSDKCYQNNESGWGYREIDAMGGHDPYSASKGCAELVTAAWRQSFLSKGHVALGSARAGNVIGGGDWAEDRLVPDIVRAFVAGCPAAIRNPHAVRPWQHVLEPLSGYLTLAQQLVDQGQNFAEGWNFGPGDDDTRDVFWIVRHLAELWGNAASWQQDIETTKPHEAQQLRLDCAKARQRLGWRPRLNLSQALGWTVAWYRAHSAHEDMRATTERQINDYMVLTQ